MRRSTRPEPISAPSSKTSIIEAGCIRRSATNPRLSSKPNSATSKPSERTQPRLCHSNPVSQPRGAVHLIDLKLPELASHRVVRSRISRAGAHAQVDRAHDFLKRAFSGSLHAKRILSLANGTLGVLTGASLAVSVIGHALAQARGLADRHAIKQVDRLLSNAGVVVWDLFAPWAREVVGQRKAIVVAMDWTDFDADNQATLALNLVTRHGRATPLLWLTVDKDELKDQRNDFEDLCLTRLKAILPEGVAGDDPGRSRLRRRQTVRIPRKPRLRLHHPLSRQRSCDRGGRPDAPGRRLGRQG